KETQGIQGSPETQETLGTRGNQQTIGSQGIQGTQRIQETQGRQGTLGVFCYRCSGDSDSSDPCFYAFARLAVESCNPTRNPTRGRVRIQHCRVGCGLNTIGSARVRVSFRNISGFCQVTLFHSLLVSSFLAIPFAVQITSVCLIM